MLPEQIWELAEGKFLFDGTWTPNSSYTPEAHLAQITAVFGDFPQRLLDRCKNRERYFDPDGEMPPFNPTKAATWS